MPSFSGKFQHADPQDAALSGACRLSFEGDNLTVAPEQGVPWVFDLGDIDVFTPGDYELRLTLYTGDRFVLNQFGKAFPNLLHDLLEAYRRRLVKCLLLEDLEEIGRFEGFVALESPTRPFASPAELRLYKSNIAVLPTQATALQWRFADLDGVHLDESAYSVTLKCGDERLVVNRLAKRTEEFATRLRDAVGRLREQAAAAVHDLFPFLDPGQSRQAAELMAEGRAASIVKLRAVSSGIEHALAANAVDARLKPYYDALLRHTPSGWLYAGFKLLRPDEVQSGSDYEEAVAGSEVSDGSVAAAEAGESSPGPPGDQEPILYWFFFPLRREPRAATPSNIVAWEATSRSGRATYLFRLVEPAGEAVLADPQRASTLVDAAIHRLNHAIGLLNFKREPIYLPDKALTLDPRFRRYAIACRKLPELRQLRESFLGRAIHTAPGAWQKQLETFLA